MEELKDSVFKAIKERLNSSVFVNFCISWMIINWKVTVFIFLSNKSDIKFYLYPYILEGYINDYWQGLFYPIIVSLGLSMLLPFLNSVLDYVKKYIYRNRDVLIEENILKESTIPTSIYKKVYDENESLNRKYKDAISKFNTIVTQNEANISEVNRLSKELSKEVNEHQKNIINLGSQKKQIDELKDALNLKERSLDSIIYEFEDFKTKTNSLSKIHFVGKIIQIKTQELTKFKKSELALSEFILENPHSPSVQIEFTKDIFIINDVHFKNTLILFDDSIWAITKAGENLTTIRIENLEHYSLFHFYDLNTKINNIYIGEKINI